MTPADLRKKEQVSKNPPLQLPGDQAGIAMNHDAHDDAHVMMRRFPFSLKDFMRITLPVPKDRFFF